MPYPKEDLYLSISKWAEEDKPREKLVKNGRTTLSNAELLAILLGSGTRSLSAVGLAKQILNTYDNDLNELGKLKVAELKQFKGVGEAKAVTIVSALELGRRRKAAIPRRKHKITCSNDAFEILSPNLNDLHHEEFWMLLLNRANQVGNCLKISSGGMTGTVADPKIIFQTALSHNAVGVIMAHNHPSGNLKPSQADIALTRKLVDAGKLLEIAVLDHLIISDQGYFSFADEGMM